MADPKDQRYAEEQAATMLSLMERKVRIGSIVLGRVESVVPTTDQLPCRTFDITVRSPSPFIKRSVITAHVDPPDA